MFFLLIAMALTGLPEPASAQSYRFTDVRIEGNQRIEPGTIMSYAGIARGETVSAAGLNDAYQRILGSGLFESVEIEPRGSTLLISVTEFPTINRISFEGNRRIDDDVLQQVIESEPRRVFSASVAERDATRIAEAFNNAGRLGAQVTPRIIRRGDNRVDLVFEIFEGGLVEIERIGFVGNQVYSDNRLRRVLESKQAGLLRAFIRKDTFVADRIEFDKQVLNDFYQSRGYVDFRTTGVNAELTRERDGYFITFNIYEGQQFRFGEITTTTELGEVDPDEFRDALRVRPGVVYSPSVVENSIARLERLAIRKGLDFIRVEPRITRNDRDLTLDVEFAIVRGPRIFVERIDIEGNATTLDRVVRRQFRIVEGDPFNPREIRESAERIRALGFFETADVNAREGSSPDQVVVEVDVEEKPTGSLSFGGAFSSSDGFSLQAALTEENFLGRGQRVSLSLSGAEDNRVYRLQFTEPALLGRDLEFGIDVGYIETDNLDSNYDTDLVRFRPSLGFPVGERSRLNLFYQAESVNMEADYEEFTAPLPAVVTGSVISDEAGLGRVLTSSVGYTYSYDSKINGLNPNAGWRFQFGQEFAGLGGDNKFIRTTAKASAETSVLNEEVTLRASLEGGALTFSQGTSRVTDRFNIGGSIMRGFSPDGIGPRQYVDDGAGNVINDALGGNIYAVAKLEAEFPLGLPEEYGIRGGAFYDVGSVWGLDDSFASGASGIQYEDRSFRHVVGLSIFWNTPIGPLRFNFTKALEKEALDDEQKFDVTLSTRF
ncbi:outer membrane protein assembly factor BamA [Lutimaribacter sp. EGI FJ00015]|uniref:Outer membrane protein assembly factor BamA n=2 Tax=Lutimaribacter degradans TaxID=2945989 RepID=A0ACC5ZVV0_9RHOB|nr:outer membrane protein assembly factor BamA [Lutimaribacter sp. EGI FJ00013]MCM2562462.1 outer membrane protein assembly factor BamA [Lutimaribacter sp. EGI FJ00013]MCO0613619.1 outer membrane protein assembly factor BamA [Lutimaribacter sp. EGI FJ00015]MCO0636591.1 outer membrane protein assembly factor BamA [Lutimaribacter sp. EGI FJ00014]